MQIYMKMTIKQRKNLESELKEARENLRYSNAEIASLSGVDPSQVSRICNGHFKTMSNNVVQVCKALGLKVEDVAREPRPQDPQEIRLHQSVHRLVSNRPDLAGSIAKVLDGLGELTETTGKPDRIR